MDSSLGIHALFAAKKHRADRRGMRAIPAFAGALPCILICPV